MAACCVGVRPDLSAEWSALAGRVRDEIARQQVGQKSRKQLPPVSGWVLQRARGEARWVPPARKGEVTDATDIGW